MLDTISILSTVLSLTYLHTKRRLYRCKCVQFSSVAQLWLFATPWTATCRLPCPSPTPRACSNSCPSSWWGHPTISSFVVAFSSCLQFFPASGSFLMSQLFLSGSQSIGAAASILQSFQWIFRALVTLLSVGLLGNAVKMQINGPHPPSLLKYSLLGGSLAMSLVTSSSRR